MQGDQREVFAYTALDTSGQQREGTLLAVSPVEVAQQLPTGWIMLACEPLAEGAPPRPGPPRDVTERLPATEGEALAGHLAALTQAGVPLEGGLRALMEELPKGRFRRGVERLVARLEAGVDLQTAVRDSGAPETLQAVIRGGLQQGDLGGALARHAATSQTLSQSRLIIWSALTGPLVGGGICILLLLLLVGWILPRFAELYGGFGLQLPLLTVWILRAGEWLNAWSPVLLMGFAAVVVPGLLLGRLWGGRETIAGWLGWVPLVGPLLRSLGLVRLCDTLSLLVESRVPLPEALRLAGEASGDRGLRQESQRLAGELAAGDDVNARPRRWRRLPAGLIDLIATAGNQSTLVALLQAQTSLQVQRARGLTQLLVLLLPWLLLPLLGTLVAVVLVAVFLPLMQVLRILA